MSTAINPTSRARAVGIKTQYKNQNLGSVRALPQRIAVLALCKDETTPDLSKVRITSAKQARELFGIDSDVKSK